MPTRRGRGSSSGATYQPSFFAAVPSSPPISAKQLKFSLSFDPFFFFDPFLSFFFRRGVLNFEIQTNFSFFVISREWPGHQVLLVLTDFFNFSRNDVTGRACRGASTGVSPPRWAHFSFKKKKCRRAGIRHCSCSSLVAGKVTVSSTTKTRNGGAS